MFKLRHLKRKRLAVGGFAVSFVVAFVFAAIIPNVFANTAYYLANANVVLDGENDGSVTISLNTPIQDSIYSIEGNFQTSDDGNYFTLTTLTPANGITPSSNTVVDGRIVWQDSTWVNPLVLGERESMWSATYVVDKDTPAGEYSLHLYGAWVASESEGYDTANLGDLAATVTVIRNETPGEKPEQVVTFKDSDDNVIGEEGITKFYGDEEFTVTKEVTTGDGEILQYHPDDDGQGIIAYTVLDSDLVGVGEPGEVDICAWLDETENYAATKACYTVHVMKRPLDIIGVAFEEKTFDGTTNVVVTGVNFADRNLNSDQYEATAQFDDANVGENKDVSVEVALVNGAEDRYVLNASIFNTKTDILPYHLVRENVELIGDGHFSYNADGVEPEVRVQAEMYGGITTLVEGQDYEVSYSDNVNVGTGHVMVTGIGNYTTGDGSVVVDFAIEPRGINNDNLVVPNSIVEGRILTENDININVDGVDLVRCENDEDTDCDYLLEISGENDGIIGHIVHVATEGRNNYTGVAVKDIEIVAKLSQVVTFEGGDAWKTYGDDDFTNVATTDGDGEIIYRSSNESVALVDGNTGLVEIKGVGTATITATAGETDDYAEGSASYNIVVSKKTITIEDVTIEDKDYDGTNVAEVSGVTLSERSLLLGTDFEASGSFNDSSVGSHIVVATVTLSSDTFEHYCFEIETECSDVASVVTDALIRRFALTNENMSVQLIESEYTYDGEAKEPIAIVLVDLDGDGVMDDELVAGVDFVLSYENNVNAGTASVTISGQGNFTNEVYGNEFTILPAEVTDVEVTTPSQTYSGEALEPAPTVTGMIEGERVTFTANDFEIVEHDDFVDANDYGYTIIGKTGSNYIIPETDANFTIEKAESREPAEVTAGLEIEAGKKLAELGERTEGFTWDDENASVALGENEYAATYIENNDNQNYNARQVMVPVYGLKRVEITIGDSDGGEVTGVTGSALEGDEVTLTISPDEGFELKNITVNGEDVTANVSNNELTITVGENDLTIEATFRRVYEVIVGDRQTHVRGVDGETVFEINADFELFDGGAVYVDGELVSPDNYEATAGSTIISFNAEYMDSLGLGEHTLAVMFNDDGIARATFNIADPREDDGEEPGAADTGSFTRTGSGAVAIIGTSAVVVMALVGVALGIVKRGRKA